MVNVCVCGGGGGGGREKEVPAGGKRASQGTFSSFIIIFKHFTRKKIK